MGVASERKAPFVTLTSSLLEVLDSAHAEGLTRFCTAMFLHSNVFAQQCFCTAMQIHPHHTSDCTGLPAKEHNA